MSTPDEALIDAIAEAIQDVGEYVPGSHGEDYINPDKAARAAYAAMVEHLGLRWQDWAEIWGMDAPKRRLVSKWQEVEP